MVDVKRVGDSGAHPPRRDPPGRQGPRAVALRVERGAARLVGRSTGTFVYLFVLTITVWLLSSLDAHTADVLLRSASTNVVQMSRSAPRVLVLSAFVVSDGNVLAIAVVFAVVHLPAERWLGTRRWLAVIVAGHVGASIITTVGILLLLGAGQESQELVYPIDVGVSYTLAAAAAALTFRLQRPLRVVWVAGVAASFRLDRLLTAPTFTDVGHLCAFGIGLVMAGLLLPARSGVRPPLPRTGAPRAWWDYLCQPPPTRRAIEARPTGWWPATRLVVAVLVGVGFLWLAHASEARTSGRIVSVPAQVTAIEQSCASGCPRLHLVFTYDGARQEITAATPATSRERVGATRVVQFPADHPADAVVGQARQRLDPGGFLTLAASAAFGVAGLMALLLVRRQMRFRHAESAAATGEA